jgi:glycoside/pentoside/hexuronide:cation symporter, GPH family
MMDGVVSSDAGLSKGQLTKKTLAFYALPWTANTIQLMPLTVFIAGFYSTNMGLPLALVGLALSVSRLSDIVTDLMLGGFSDRLRTRWGRRKPMILAGIPLSMLGVWLLFVPPPGATIYYLFAAIIFMNLATSTIEVAYSAFGAEMSRHYDERNRVTTWRASATVFGNLLALSIPFILQKMGHSGTGNALFGMALLYVILMPLFFIPVLTSVQERPAIDLPQDSPNWRESVAIIWQNKAFRALFFGLILFFGGKAISSALNMIVISEVIDAASSFPLMLLLENIASLLAVPIWFVLAKRLGKSRTMVVAALWSGGWSFPLFFLGAGDSTAFIAVIAIRAMALSAFMILMPSMTADAVDVDTLASGRERTGIFFGALNMGTKGAAALGILIGTSVPALAGFQPSDAVHSPDSLLALRVVYAIIGPLMVLGSAYFFGSFPINRDKQKELREAIDARNLSALSK